MVALAFLIPLAMLVQQLAHERALAKAERQGAVVVAVLAVTADPDAVQQVISGIQGLDPSRVTVHDPDGATIGVRHASNDEIDLAARQRQPVVVPASGGLAYLEPVETGEDTVAVVEVYVPQAELSAGVRTAWYALAAVAVGLVLASIAVGDRLAARVVDAARRFARAATSLGDGDVGVRVRPGGPRELAEAAVAFNQMADRLATSRTKERELVADLSHRLRTPLTVLRLDAETLDAAGPSPYASEETDNRRTARRIRQAIATLEQEVDTLIQTTRSATAIKPGPPARCDASEVVRERMTFWSAVAEDQNRPYTVLGTERPAPVPIPEADLAAALDAVLGNVFRYTPQGTALEVAVSRHDGYAAVRVDDAGPGIPDPDRALRRGASDRGSTGLGLDIARQVAQAGGGSVSIDRALLGGASVVMLFTDADTPPPEQPSRFGLIGRLGREPGARPWPRQRRLAAESGAPRWSRQRRARVQPGARRWPRQRRASE